MSDLKSTIIRGYREDIMEDRCDLYALQQIRNNIETDDRLSERDANGLLAVINQLIDDSWSRMFG